MSVTVPAGFVAGGVASGIKGDGRLDLAYVGFASGLRHVGAAVFTTNAAAAAPVLVSRSHLEASQGMLRGVVLSSGNANALTGEEGLRDARAMTEEAASVFGGAASDYLVCSTGLIGIPLPIDAVRAGIRALSDAVGGAKGAAERAARAIMTTDTHPKLVAVNGEGFAIGGMAKGAAMIAPNMATMLAVLTTDAILDPDRAKEALAWAVERTFNRITIDGCTSTNDTVVLLSSGLGAAPGPELEERLEEAAGSLARQIVADAEGGSRVGTIRVEGARDEAEALRVARQVASSLLVKCSLLGGDPYWGRVVAEAGVALADLDVTRVSVAYQHLTVLAEGRDVTREWDEARRAELARRMQEPEILVEIALARGSGAAEVLTADIGPGYLEENRGTS
jgi:glutamate N-acetyltransferase/amino-acid N-acetyltransferase